MLLYSNAIMQENQQLSRPKIFSRASPRQRLTATGVFLVLAVFFGLFALAGHYKITLYPFPCGFKQRYNLPCPTCGVTTSVIAFAQGKIFDSFYIQPAAALLCSILVVSAIFALFIAVSGIYFNFLNRFFAEIKIKYVIIALIVVIALGWAVTLTRALMENNQN
jgi:Na+/citrate or Na+/malate symporter